MPDMYRGELNTQHSASTTTTMHHFPSSPLSASSFTLIATPPVSSKPLSSLRDQCAPCAPTAIPGKGYIQPHHAHLPRRHVRRHVRAAPVQATILSEAAKKEARRSTWARTSCLQQIGPDSGIFIAFSTKPEPVKTTRNSACLSTLLAAAPEGPQEKVPTYSDDTRAGASPAFSSKSQGNSPLKPEEPPLPAPAPPPEHDLNHDLLSEFTAIIHLSSTSSPSPSPSSSPPTHTIPIPADPKDDGTPHLTSTQFKDAHAFLESGPFASPPTPEVSRPHPRHGTRVPAALQRKVLIIAPRTHAVDALALAVGRACLAHVRLPVPPPEDADELAEVDVVTASSESPGVPLDSELSVGSACEEPSMGADHAVHTFLARLHDCDHEGSWGLRDEWRGVLSQSGMDALAVWIDGCKCVNGV